MIVHLLGAAGVVSLVVFLGILPRNISNTLGEGLGRLTYLTIGRWRRVALNNLRNVYGGGAEGPARAVFAHLGRSVAEVSRLALGRTVDFRDIRAEGYEHLEAAVRRGKGVLFITGHCGNWELMAQYVGLHHPSLIVGRRVNNPVLDRMLLWFRGRTGNRGIHKGGALRRIIRELRSGGLVAMLMDQGVVESEGVEIDFLNHRAWAMKIPALVAMKTGCTVLPIFSHRRDDGGHTIRVEAPVEVTQSGDTERDLAENTIRMSACIERYIMQYPDQWLWIHRRWKRAAETVWERRA